MLWTISNLCLLKGRMDLMARRSTFAESKSSWFPNLQQGQGQNKRKFTENQSTCGALQGVGAHVRLIWKLIQSFWNLCLNSVKTGFWSLKPWGQYFKAAEGNRGTRFNWYRDGSDWKPFHHDSEARQRQLESGSCLLFNHETCKNILQTSVVQQFVVNVWICYPSTVRNPSHKSLWLLTVALAEPTARQHLTNRGLPIRTAPLVSPLVLLANWHFVMRRRESCSMFLKKMACCSTLVEMRCLEFISELKREIGCQLQAWWILWMNCD